MDDYPINHERIWLTHEGGTDETGPLWCQDQVTDEDVEYINAQLYDERVAHLERVISEQREYHDEWMRRVVREKNEDRDRIRELEALLDSRAGRLLNRHIPFIVVKQAEPYYCEVYGTIRQYELAKGEWTQEDENIYRGQCALFGRFESGSEPEAIR